MISPSANRQILPHITQLPRSPRFTASQLKHYLPIHLPTLKGNLLSILYNLLPQFQNHSTFYPDVTLENCLTQKGLSQVQAQYDTIRTFWCQDIDQSEHHLRKSLEIGVIISDYLWSLSNSQKIKTIPHQNINMIAKIQRLTLFGNNQQYTKVIESQQNQPRQFKNFDKKLFSYCIWKQKNKQNSYLYYFTIAYNNNSGRSITSLLRSFRNWNCKRLKCNTSINDWRTIQHIFSIGRSFLIGNKYQDFNSSKHYLKKMNQAIIKMDYSTLDFYQFCKSQQMFSTLVEQKDTILITYKATLKFKSSPQDHLKQLWNCISHLLCQVWVASPLKTSISYHYHFAHHSSTNELVLVFSIAYSLKTQSLMSGNDVEQMVLKCSQFLRSSFHEQSISRQNIADQIFRRSINILNKYNEIPKRSEEETKKLSPFKKISHLTPIQFSISQEQPVKSMANSYYQNQLSLNSSSLSIASQRPPQSSLKVQNSYYQLLKKIEQYSPICSPYQLQLTLVPNINNLQQKYKIKSFKQESEQIKIILKSIGSMCLKCTSDQVVTLILNNLQEPKRQSLYEKLTNNEDLNHDHSGSINVECILQIFLQPQQWQIGWIIAQKIAKQGHLINMIRNYVSEGLQKSRFTVLMQILKKMIVKYGCKVHISSLNFKEIDTQDIINILQYKKTPSQVNHHRILVYNNVVKKIINKILTNISNKTSILPIIHSFYQQLSQENTTFNQEHISSFLAELTFQCVYFTNDNITQTGNFLSNAFYKEQITDNDYLKNKKVLQIVRNYGFRGMGYECSRLFIDKMLGKTERPLPLNFKAKLKNPIYYLVQIRRAQYLKRFVQIMQKSHHTPNLIPMISFFVKHKATILDLKNQQLKEIFYLKNIQDFSFQNQLAKEQNLLNQEYILKGAKNSESGIFKHLLSHNPNIKIAGLPLSRILEPKVSSQKLKTLIVSRNLPSNEKKMVTDLKNTISENFPSNLEQSYNIINLVINLRQKYVGYHLLDENQRNYFKQIADQINEKKQNIMNYLQFSKKMLQYKNYLEAQKQDSSLSNRQFIPQ